MTSFSTQDPEYKADIEDYADLILEYLHQLGVEYVFGVPGGAIEPLYNALARSARRGGPKAIIARHECGAAFMAEGYYRETGKLGVVCSTTGPGATNLITGVASASVDKSPMLVLTAQTALPKFGKRPLQDSSETAIDTVGIFRNCTKFNALISHPEQLESKLISALMESVQSPKGPVHLSIPSDILRGPYGHKDPNVQVNYLMQRASLVDKNAVDRLVDEICEADNIVLFIGHDCRRAYKQIEKLAEAINAPFVSGPMGKSWVNERHPLYRGVYGYAGHESAHELFKDPNIELVLAIGTSITEMGIGSLGKELLNNKLIHVDSTVESFSRSPMAKLHVCGHLNTVFNRVLNKVCEYGWNRTWQGLKLDKQQNVLGGYTKLIEPEKCFSDAVPIKPQRLMAYLSEALSPSTRVFIDTGNIWAWATHYLSHTAKEGLYRVSMGFGSMAWAIGAVIGSALASRDEPHVCLSGDGAWLMSSHEIGVAVQHQLPILFVVLNDSAFGMIRFGQQLSKAESIGWQLNEVDFAALAKAQGANGYVIEEPKQLMDLDLEAIFSAKVPTLLDVRIDPDEMPPMMARVNSLKEESNSAIGYT
ncbi:thiamine pyrophosphate-binding protein [Thalassomonas haliotis]|uniref:Thiamine pyrophosphate-binding protein n=1 Tax=Thalassomonas haliotis TaxID=485448 RepID=A0ABY7VK73_9GAMM|nr:thiamine pyrophosphate-binding protein [Thalassomonas haliotis]WDE13866.1 thiamine pyrophosphate-binding protein [Thalassomonas haliotis]